MYIKRLSHDIQILHEIQISVLVVQTVVILLACAWSMTAEMELTACRFHRKRSLRCFGLK